MNRESTIGEMLAACLPTWMRRELDRRRRRRQRKRHGGPQYMNPDMDKTRLQILELQGGRHEPATHQEPMCRECGQPTMHMGPLCYSCSQED